MGETGRLAVFHGTGKPFEIREYPVPEPEPGALLVKIALANVCGSDLHYWRGEQNYEKMGRPLPLNTGHEHVGTVATLVTWAVYGGFLVLRYAAGWRGHRSAGLSADKGGSGVSRLVPSSRCHSAEHRRQAQKGPSSS